MTISCDCGDTDVTACWYHDGEYSITTGYNTPSGHTFVRDNDNSAHKEEADSTDSSPSSSSVSSREMGSTTDFVPPDLVPTTAAADVEKVRLDSKTTKISDGLFHCK